MTELEILIRQHNPFIEVCDNGTCQTYITGDATYEAWVARTVDEHTAAQAVIQAEMERQAVAQAVQDALTTLHQHITILRDPQQTVDAAMFREGLAYTDETLATLISYLAGKGVIR